MIYVFSLEFWEVKETQLKLATSYLFHALPKTAINKAVNTNAKSLKYAANRALILKLD